jgi:hypothetical protein
VLYADVAGRVLLGIVFAIACIGKVRSAAAFNAFAESLRDLGWLTGSARRAVAVAIPASEGAVVILLAWPATASWGFAAGLSLLGALTIGAGIAIGRGQRVECRCFGSTAKPMGATELIRNGILIAVALAGLTAGLSAQHGPVSAVGMTLTVGIAWLGGLLIVGWDEISYLITADPA